MRDIALVLIVAGLAAVALARPWVGVMLWTWLSLMSPHRYAYGFAQDAPLAAVAAASTLVGFAFTKNRSMPFKGAPVVWLAVFMVWMTLSYLLGFDPSDDYEQWSKVMKIDVMVFAGLALLHSRLHIVTLAWICAGSLALLGIKGGVFTIATGGNYRVWGPPGSFIGDNNEMGLAMVMTIPLLRFLQMQLTPGWRRHALTLVMLLCAATAFGSQSRGALLAIAAMVTVLWWRGKSRWLGGVLILLAGAGLIAFMPDTWSDRMHTISEYEQDGSAMGRISAWWTAYGVAKSYVFGAGYNVARPELFAMFSPWPERVHAAHSIYFQVLGNHGFVGLLLFLGVFITTYLWAGKLRRESRAEQRAAWCGDLGAMAQVSLIGYGVGGAFLSLSYFDLPYNIMMLVVLARVWLRSRAWEREPLGGPKWLHHWGVRERPSASGNVLAAGSGA